MLDLTKKESDPSSQHIGVEFPRQSIGTQDLAANLGASLEVHVWRYSEPLGVLNLNSVGWSNFFKFIKLIGPFDVCLPSCRMSALKLSLLSAGIIWCKPSLSKRPTLTAVYYCAGLCFRQNQIIIWPAKFFLLFGRSTPKKWKKYAIVLHFTQEKVVRLNVRKEILRLRRNCFLIDR